MRIAFITGSLVHGGAERQAITLANRLSERGHDCHAIYVKNDPSQLERLSLVAPSSVRCLHARRYFDLNAISHLHAFFERLAPDAVLATNPYALMYASLAGRGIPLAVAAVSWLFVHRLLPETNARVRLIAGGAVMAAIYLPVNFRRRT